MEGGGFRSVDGCAELAYSISEKLSFFGFCLVLGVLGLLWVWFGLTIGVM